MSFYRHTDPRFLCGAQSFNVSTHRSLIGRMPAQRKLKLSGYIQISGNHQDAKERWQDV